MIMKKVTLDDVRRALAELNETFLVNLSDERLLRSDFLKDLHIYNGHIRVMHLLCKNKHMTELQGLHQCLPDRTVQSLINTMNLYIRESKTLGVDFVD